MFGLLRCFSGQEVEGRSLLLHGCWKGSMLGSGCRDVGRLSPGLQSFATLFLVWSNNFFMTPLQVLSDAIRYSSEEASVLGPIYVFTMSRLSLAEVA